MQRIREDEKGFFFFFFLHTFDFSRAIPADSFVVEFSDLLFLVGGEGEGVAHVELGRVCLLI